MAQSRLERIGTIYTRVSSLMKGGVWKEGDKPLWYDIYTNFPPKYEPCYGRETKYEACKEIFYEEDIIRAKFHKDNRNLPQTSLTNQNFDSVTQRFILLYQQLKKDGVPEAELYEKAKQIYFMHAPSLKTKKQIVKDDTWKNDTTEKEEQLDTNESISKPKGHSQQSININIKNLFDNKE